MEFKSLSVTRNSNSYLCFELEKNFILKETPEIFFVKFDMIGFVKFLNSIEVNSTILLKELTEDFTTIKNFFSVAIYGQEQVYDNLVKTFIYKAEERLKKRVWFKSENGNIYYYDLLKGFLMEEQFGDFNIILSSEENILECKKVDSREIVSAIFDIKNNFEDKIECNYKIDEILKFIFNFLKNEYIYKYKEWFRFSKHIDD